MIVCLRDITNQVMLERERDRAKLEAEQIDIRAQEVMKLSQRNANLFLREVEISLPQIKEGLIKHVDIPRCYRLIHTLKGIGRTHGFKELSSAAHNLEDILDVKAGIIHPWNASRISSRHF